MRTNITHYRDFLRKYADSTKQRRPGFSMGSWARALGLKSTSSLTKVINGEREAGPELLQKLIDYFKFNAMDEAQFRNLVALSKLKESSEMKQRIAESLLNSEQSKSFKKRMIELEQFELLESYLPLAIRECTRLSKMTITKLGRFFPEVDEEKIKKTLNTLSRLGMVSRDDAGHFIADDDQVQTDHEIPSEAIQDYHDNCLQLAQEKLKTTELADREFQSLTILINRNDLPEFKEKMRGFLDSLELSYSTEEVNQVYQIQLQMFPLSEPFKNQINPSHQLPLEQENKI